MTALLERLKKNDTTSEVPDDDESRASNLMIRVRKEQVNLVYKNAFFAMKIAVVNLLIVTIILWKVVLTPVLIAWLVCNLIVIIFRYLLIYRYRHREIKNDKISNWGRYFFIGSLLSGLAFGSSAIFLFPLESIVHQVFLAFVLGGMVAGAVGAYSVIMEIFLSYSTPVAVPIIARFFIQGDDIHLSMGAMSLLFFIAMTVIARRLHSTTKTSLKLQFKNVDLVTYLTKAKEITEKLNEELKSEITERKQAEGALQRAHFELESRVEERTIELKKVNEELNQEITDRKKAEKTVRESEEKFRNLVETTNDWVWEVNKKLLYTYVSPKFRDILGYEPEEILGKTPFDLMPPDEVRRIANIFSSIAAQKESFKLLENINLHKSGHQVVIETSGVPFFDKDGNVQGYRGIDRDITERKRMEEELLKIQKLESVGVLAGGIAHDFNNLLTGILGNISLAKIFVRPDNKAFKRLTEAENASMRAKDLTQQLITFSKGGAPIKKRTYIGELIKDSASFALRGSNVRCEFSISDAIWPVEVDEGQINQVINNLIINSDQAMTEGGMINVGVENITIDEIQGSEVKGQELLKDGKYVKISISDQGVGIAEEHLKNIFDPYFSTKQKGSGLGLTTAYSIIKNHDGLITVESEIGVGTTFYIYLPALNAELKEQRAESRDKGIAHGKGKIMVMDDEEIVRDVVGEMLKSVGYEVEFAQDGAKAIELYKKVKESGESFNAVIMDLTIPGGMGGKEAIKKLLEIDPAVKAIVSSGYSNDQIVTDFRKYGFCGVISKPYKIKELSEVLHKVIEGIEALL